MSNKRRGKSKAERRAGVMTDDTFKDSLHELAENLDSLVDGLTGKMSDAPLDLPPPNARASSAGPPATQQIAAGSVSLSDDSDLMEFADRIVGELTERQVAPAPPEARRAPIAREAPQAFAPPEASAEDIDLDALTDRMIDSIKEGPAAATIDRPPAPVPPAEAGPAPTARENVFPWSGPRPAEPIAAASAETAPLAPPAAPPSRASERRPEVAASAPARETTETVIPWAAETPTAPAKRARREPRRLAVAALFALGATVLTWWLLSSNRDARAHRQPAVARSPVEHETSKPEARAVPPPMPSPIEEEQAPAPAPSAAAPATQEPVKLRLPGPSALQPTASAPEPSTKMTPPAPAKPTSTIPKPAATKAVPSGATKEPATASAKQPPPAVAKEAPPEIAEEAPPASTVTPAVPEKPPVAERIEPPAPLATPAPPPPSERATAPEPAAAAATYQAPRLLQRQTPQYPERLRKQSEGGLVVLKLLISEQGRPVRVVVEQGLPGSELEGRAIDAALRSVYEPAKDGGKPVSAWVVERFLFEP